MIIFLDTSGSLALTMLFYPNTKGLICIALSFYGEGLWDPPIFAFIMLNTEVFVDKIEIDLLCS